MKYTFEDYQEWLDKVNVIRQKYLQGKVSTEEMLYAIRKDWERELSYIPFIFQINFDRRP